MSANDSEIFFNTPSKNEFLNYIKRQQSKQRIKQLEESPDRDSSPELSDSFKIYLSERKKKAEEEKMKLLKETEKENQTLNVSVEKRYTNNKKSISNIKNDSLDEDSFLENEKFCENTIHLDNVSEHLIDLTANEDANESFLEDLMRKKSINFNDETHLNEIEEPSFFFNNTSLMSPNKHSHSPMKMVRENRPSTIMEITETSVSNKTSVSSYHTAQSTTTSGEKSEYYQTANESLDSTANLLTVKRPTLKPFYEETIFDLTKDSLDDSNSKQMKSNEMTVDSLNQEGDKSNADSSSGIETSYDDTNEHCIDSFNNKHLDSPRLDDTLERIDFMLAQAKKMTEEKKLLTPKPVKSSPASNKASPLPWSATKNKPAQSKLKTTPSALGATKNSPLMKFSPAVKSNSNNSPSQFKLPLKPASTSKLPQLTPNNKKFEHIVSPIACYINRMPELPLSSNAHIQYGVGNSRHFNFRDSESFCKKSLDKSLQSSSSSSLPIRAKTKNANVKTIVDQRSLKTKIPGGEKIHTLLGNSSPTVTVHKGHTNVKAPKKNADMFKDNTLNSTDFDEQSFANMSLMPGDVSVQVVEGIKRIN